MMKNPDKAKVDAELNAYEQQARQQAFPYPPQMAGPPQEARLGKSAKSSK